MFHKNFQVQEIYFALNSLLNMRWLAKQDKAVQGICHEKVQRLHTLPYDTDLKSQDSSISVVLMYFIESYA